MLVGQQQSNNNLGPEDDNKNPSSNGRIWTCGLNPRSSMGGPQEIESKIDEATSISSLTNNRSGNNFGSIQSRAKAQQILTRRLQLARYKAHPWPFLCEQVLTEDPHDKAGLIKPFPQLDYLKRLVEVWVQERRLLVPKSRRMLVSWTFIALHVWLLLFHDREYIYFAARKEGRDESEGSLELVKRAKFIINNLRDFSPPPTDQKRGRIICLTTHSEIVAVAQGQHQMRQLSATAILADELAFWEHARETYTAARPTIEGTGRFTGVSSAHPGFFKNLVFDEVT